MTARVQIDRAGAVRDAISRAKFRTHLRYLDELIASIPGPLVLRDEWEAAEWRRYSAYLDRLWNAKPEVARAMEILRRRANAR